MNSTKININSTCPICSEVNKSNIFELNNYPLTELFHSKKEPSNFEITSIDQAFCFCEKCNHGFLRNVISPDFLYQKSNYNTVTSTSRGALISVENFSKFIKNSSNYTNDYVIDIGGNDSNLLENLMAKEGMVIDPNCNTSNPNFISINKFFEDIDPSEIGNNKNISIVSSHTLEHVENPHAFFEFLSDIKGQNSFFLQFPSLELMVESSRYDMIHHQHIHYYSLDSIEKIANLYSMSVVNHEFDHEHYGTLRVEIKKTSNITKYSSSHKYSSEELIRFTNNFSEFCKLHNYFFKELKNLICYGASLMLPITYYYFPVLLNSISILDTDKSKSFLKYANIKTPIMHDNLTADLSDKTIFITANATRFANRIITTKLIERNAKYIVNPFPTS